jgi:hypothetical protein
MPKPLALVSSSDIQGQAFLDVVRAVGGVIEDAKALQGRISQGERHVWVALDHSLLSEYEADEIELIRQKLGGKPQSCIVLNVSRTAGSERLALAFACTCAERWPCVVYNLRDKVLSASELLRLRKTEKADLPL